MLDCSLAVQDELCPLLRDYLRLNVYPKNTNTLHTWIAKYHRPKAAAGKTEKNDAHIYDELKRLRKENARLKEGHAILKNSQPDSSLPCEIETL